MGDDRMNAGSADRATVDVHAAWEVTWWCDQWNITKEELVAAVQAVGPGAKTVAEHLGKPYPV